MEYLDRQVFDPFAESLHYGIHSMENFVIRFFTLIDPELSAVKGFDIFRFLTDISCGSCNCLQSDILEFCSSCRQYFWCSILMIEWNSRFLTNLFGDRYRGCYALALTIFGLGIVRDYLYF